MVSKELKTYDIKKADREVFLLPKLAFFLKEKTKNYFVFLVFSLVMEENISFAIILKHSLK